jgi:hypothetical protein
LTLPGLEPQPLSRPARSHSLYRLRYPSYRDTIIITIIIIILFLLQL